MLTSSGPKPLFACAILTALCVGLPALLGWLGEKKRAGRPGIRGCCETARSVYDEITDRPEKKKVIRDDIIESLVKIYHLYMTSIIQLSMEISSTRSQESWVKLFSVVGCHEKNSSFLGSHTVKCIKKSRE